MNYNFHMPVRLVTGENCVRDNAALLKPLGGKCMIVTGKSAARRSGALDDVQASLESQGIEWVLFDEVKPNPLLEDSYRAGEAARSFGADFVIGIGGGSPLDAAKAIAAYAGVKMELMDIYKLEWVGRALPMVAVGTTAGTGSEVAPYAVMTTPDGRKNSFASVQGFPVISFGDPRYTWSLPWRFTVSTALDAMSHSIEAYFSTKANDITDFFAIQAVKLLYPALKRLEESGEGSDIPHDLREVLYYASVTAGVSLAHCATCYCHKLGYFLSEEYDVPHGVACAVFLPHFIHRESRLLPHKAAALYQGAGCTQEELASLIGRLTLLDQKIPLTLEGAADIAARSAGTGSMIQTAPDGVDEAESLEILKEIFHIG